MGYRRGGFAAYAEGVVADEKPAVDNEAKSTDALVEGSTIAEIHELVEKGYLTPEEVFEAESKGKKRATLLAEYDPSK